MPHLEVEGGLLHYHLSDYTDSVTGYDRREVTEGFRFGSGIQW